MKKTKCVARKEKEGKKKKGFPWRAQLLQKKNCPSPARLHIERKARDTNRTCHVAGILNGGTRCQWQDGSLLVLRGLARSARKDDESRGRASWDDQPSLRNGLKGKTVNFVTGTGSREIN